MAILAAVGATFGQAGEPGTATRLPAVPEERSAESPGAAQGSAAGAESADKEDEDDPAESRNYHVEPRSTGTRRETEPPRYVRTLSQTEIPAFEHLNWLDLGVDYRLRIEYRDGDLRRPVAVTDVPFLMRERAYLGIKEIADPFRGYVEFEDARRFNSRFAPDNRDINETEIIQLVGELHFADALGDERPLRLQAGRMAVEYTDRRLIARNEWRNTTNNFQGLRAILGQEKNDWQLDIFAWQPMERRLTGPDRVDEQRWFGGVVGNWRRWSEIVTLQPYYLILDQDGRQTLLDRQIHTLALGGYGIVGTTGYDYDFDVAWQFGQHDSQSHRAFGFTTELGYTFEHDWKPRLGIFMGYGSGDEDPADGVNQRFDRLFGFARPWSANDYFLWENLVAPKIRMDFQPHEKLRIDMGYSTFWLASATDAWASANLRDATGQSGDFVGHELDIRLRYALTSRTDVTLGYAYFLPGSFTRNLGRPDPTNFFYVETSVRLFK